jgi:tRNA A-37 threonylcarbamoyl transferase component Bud32
MDDLPKNLRDGRYAVVRLLGEGGQAATFEAVDKKAGQPVAIKRFRVRGAKSWKEVELAEREARVLASLQHPGLPRYIDHFEEAGELFLVTELIQGESLEALRKRGAVLAEADVRAFLHEASVILDYLHGRAPPVVHRDIKPSNVLRRADGSFVVIDFGAVRDKMKPEGGSTVVGTFGYMAPEQFQGRAMPASDVYAVGATAIAMLTGREPEDLPHKGLAIDVHAALGGRVSPALQRTLAAMLEPDPDRRPSRIAPLLTDLGPAPRPARPPEQDRRSDRERRRDERREKREERRRERQERLEQKVEQGWEHFEQQWSQNEQQWVDQAERSLRYAEAKFERRRRKGQLIPGPLGLLIMLALTLTEVAVIVALRAVVPAVLTVLSVFFGKALREAARKTSESGDTAVRLIRQTKDMMRGQIEPQPGQSAGAASTPKGTEARPDGAPRVRVAQDDKARSAREEEERLAEEEAADADEAQGKQRRL